jgi:hypothetical protein
VKLKKKLGYHGCTSKSINFDKYLPQKGDFLAKIQINLSNGQKKVPIAIFVG